MGGFKHLLRPGGPKAVGTGGAAGAAAGTGGAKSRVKSAKAKAVSATGSGAAGVVARDVREGKKELKLTQVVFKGRTYEVVVKPHEPGGQKPGVKAGKEEEGTSGRRDILF